MAGMATAIITAITALAGTTIRIAMLQLAGALAAPVIGALLYGWLHHRPGAVRFLDGFMYFAVPALVAWQVVPHAWSEHGILAILVIAVGFGTPALIERAPHALAPQTDNLALLGGLSGLGLHALLEGAALSPGETSVSAAVVLHRIPVGLAIWWMLRPRHGFRAGALGIGGIVVATMVGYSAGAELLGDQGSGVELYQAFVGGSLLHVVFHQSRHDHQH